MKGKYIKDSYTEQVYIVKSSDLNGYGRLFGGQLMCWIDMVAGIVARRHAENENITTVFIDNLRFLRPAKSNDIIVLCGKVIYTGNTSMLVKVESFIENVDGTRDLINKAKVVMVALDENQRPITVPPIIPVTEEEIKAFEKAKAKKERHLKDKTK